MCGIAGAIHRDSVRERVQRMCDVLAHRGPDDEGIYQDGDVAIGMRRLAIIDVAGGHQPLSNEDGTIWVVFNGEIYNHGRLRTELQRAGHVFQTHSDTEVLVHLYEQAGPEGFARLSGMFAFAIWDAPRRRLVLARDRMGIKPLYYCGAGHSRFGFGSEVRTLLAGGLARPDVDTAAAVAYLRFGYVPDCQSILMGVHKLPPGHFLDVTQGTAPVLRPFWRASARPQKMDETEAVTELRRLLDHAVASHLESEVPLGALLSGGIDSSTVVALMTRHAQGRVRTFSIGFEEAGFNEADDARAVATALGTDHTELVVRPDVSALFQSLIAAFDEPFADSSAIPTYLVCRLARSDVTVALSGDGGDELFAGYARYAEVLGRTELPAVVRPVLQALARRLPHGARGRNRLLDLGRSRLGRYAATMLLPAHPRFGGIVRADLAPSTDDLEQAFGAWQTDRGDADLLTTMTLTDLRTYLPGDILTKVDRTSMAVSLESRVPLLDNALVDFSLALPSELKMRGGRGKWLLRRAIEGLVPARVLEKPKQGFAVPLRRWFREELRHSVDALLGDSLAYRYADRGAVQRMIREHRTQRRDHAGVIWRVLVLHGWLRALSAGELAGGIPADLRVPALTAPR
ncbi:MAG: asparagine synthase (glutamine-hydrolyzing) [Gemmatimonadales bacterium]